MKTPTPIMIGLLAAFAGAQDPAPKLRLTYELPVDALQRSLRDDPDLDLEQLLARSVANVERRLGRAASVRRGDATTFIVETKPGDRELVDELRARIETSGRLEMRMVADGDYATEDGILFDLAAERERLQAWLDDGGRERLLHDRATLATFEPESPHLRWAVRRVGPRDDDPKRWTWRFTDIPGLCESTVAVHGDDDWNGGVVPPHFARLGPEVRYLVELVAINLHERSFTNEDFVADKVAWRELPGGRGTVDYRVIPEKTGDYADFSEQYIGKHCAFLWDGELLMAPRFESRIPGVGRIDVGSKTEARRMAMAMRTPLIAKPILQSIEVR